MTCIVGVTDGTKVYIGGDSAGVSGWDLQLRRDPKVFVNAGVAFGFTTSFRIGQLLAHSFTPPKRYPDKDLYAFMVTDFVDAVRTCLKNGGVATKHEEAESGGTFLVGIEGRLFKVCSDYQVGDALDGFDACGSGQGPALGALYASAQRPPVERIKIALAAAEQFNSGVRGPMTIVST